ncbi:hypothetical protein ACO22_00948 [Paracoccidioides brasiliensis]|uniref:BTB domain-containing protein n=1 Tax=Paracoccidioides brasiliensis TaxID=121759 RepID=A0A1D2JMU2_PARBR|nr:hypothetical protein ACO22_00948 [Paracoccidioides brasiliensis]
MTCIDASFAPDRISSKQLVGMALREIYLSDDDPLDIERMVHYFYKLDYNVDDCSPCPANNMAQEYTEAAVSVAEEPSPSIDYPEAATTPEPGKQTLQSINTTLYQTLGRTREMLRRILQRYSMLKCDGDIHHIWCGRTFYSVVQVIYGTTYSGDRGLRDVIVGFAHQNITALKTRLEFEETLEEFPSFTRDLLWRMIGEDRQEEGERLTVDPTPDYHVRETT